MKCQYCGNDYKESKYGHYCESCYAPAPEKITTPAVIMVGGGEGSGGACWPAGGGGADAYSIADVYRGGGFRVKQ